uniref:Uncharacterized protein n=1 Tax=Oryza rufipogon TaxID=4529 RepID=A0A0E0P652_ORYRU
MPWSCRRCPHPEEPTVTVPHHRALLAAAPRCGGPIGEISAVRPMASTRLDRRLHGGQTGGGDKQQQYIRRLDRNNYTGQTDRSTPVRSISINNRLFFLFVTGNEGNNGNRGEKTTMATRRQNQQHCRLRIGSDLESLWPRIKLT